MQMNSPTRPLDCIVFDCDGTLSAIEGIDYLADKHGVGDAVSRLTADAMGKTGINPEIYQQRLQLVRPTLKEVLTLGQDYFAYRVLDVMAVIHLLQRLNKKVYIVSAGLYPAVVSFAELLSIPRAHVFAVDVSFDSDGNYIDFDKTSALVNNDGKRLIVAEINNIYPNIAYVGDGMNDLSVIDLVTRFIGYGGVFYRENIAARCDYYVKSLSMCALLPLLLTAEEYLQLLPSEKTLYTQGVASIK